MPFKSQAQRGYLYANNPKVAKEFQKATPKGKQLPKKLGKKKAHKARKARKARKAKKAHKAAEGAENSGAAAGGQ